VALTWSHCSHAAERSGTACRRPGRANRACRGIGIRAGGCPCRAGSGPRGEIDGLVVTADGGKSEVYTLATADRPYRFLIEQMQVGAVTLTEDGTILHGNRRMASILGVPLQEITGQNLGAFCCRRMLHASPGCCATPGNPASAMN